MINFIEILFLFNIFWPHAQEPFNLRVLNVNWIPRQQISSVIGNDNELPKFAQHKGGYLIVHISSSKNLIQFLRDSNYVLNINSFFCDKPNAPVILNSVGLYQRGVEISDQHFDVPQHNEMAISKDGRFLYELPLFDSWPQKWEVPMALRKDDQRYYMNFDLRKNPSDVCIGFSGGNIASGYHNFSAATLKIDKNTIKQAMVK